MPAMIYLNGWAIAAAAAGAIVIGFLWYGPLFGDAWLKEMGVPPDFRPDAALLKRSMLLMIGGAILTAIALACGIELCRPSTWKAGEDAPPAIYGVSAALFVWSGFYVPMLLSGVAWENRSWKWFRINAGYHFVALLAMAMILAFGQ
jgi:Protein of unknown function (DUF1761)